VAAAADRKGNNLDGTLDADRARVRSRLRDIVNRPDVREALFVASPSLDDAIAEWEADPESNNSAKAERAIVRYISRMAGRATPFGLFAGCTVGSLNGCTRLEAGASPPRRTTRLDMDYLWRLARALCSDSSVRDAFRFVPNSTMYETAGRLRYVEGVDDGEQRRYRLVAVEQNDAIRTVLDIAATCGETRNRLAAALVDGDITQADAAAFIDELIDAQILVADAEIGATGEIPHSSLHALLASREATQSHARHLATAIDELGAIDATGTGIAPSRYRAIRARLEALPAPVEIARLFQVDLDTGTRACLGDDVLRELKRAIELFARIGVPHPDALVDRFVQRFEARYEGRHVPLLDALDEEDGIGLTGGSDPSPLLRDHPSRKPEPTTIAWTDRESCMLELLTNALAAGETEIRIDANAVDRLAPLGAATLPDAFAVMATLEAESADALARGEFRVAVDNIDGPSGARLLGRFCHADESLAAHVREHLRAEERLHPDRIYAEITHLPEGRTGNILLRPVLREYEIPWLGRPAVSADRYIPPSDLLVSVEDGKVVLHSRRLGRRIEPRLTTAHNYALGVGVYRFLCALQQQGLATGAVWDWGPLAHAPFLPRVTHGRLILARARWLLGRADIERIKAGGNDVFRCVRSLRQRRGIPRWAALVDGDNVLPVDFENILSVESFAQLVTGREAALLEELPAGSLVMRGNAGRFVHQLVVPFVRRPNGGAGDTSAQRNGARSGARTQQASRRYTAHTSDGPDGEKAEQRLGGMRPAEPVGTKRVRRTFPPGSEWLYCKLYGGAAALDEVLRDVVRPLARRSLESGAIDRWFFIRYADPDVHARIRFHGPGASAGGGLPVEVRDALAPVLDSGQVRRIAFDTYEREIERYGGPHSIDLAERIFHADSEAVLDVLDLTEPGDAGLDERWQLTLIGFDRLLDDLGIELRNRIAILEGARDAWARHLRMDTSLRRQLGAKWRELRPRVEHLFDDSDPADHPLAPGIAAFDCRSTRLRPTMQTLKNLERDGHLHPGLRVVASSLLHMHANRMLRSAPNEHELILYDALARIYTARLHRRAA
jgi:thiopeptide-type bacteriocin biosynthesis protein